MKIDLDKGKRVISMDEEESRLKKKMKLEEEEKNKVSVISAYVDSSSSESEEDDREISGGYDWDGFPEDPFPPMEESEEDVISDRDENDGKYNFIVKEFRTVTNPRRPKKTYTPRSRKGNNSVLYNLDHPLAALAKLALDHYNSVQGKNYVYKGLVKAYNCVVGAFIFWIRFKAYIRDQDPINFEAMVYQGIPHKPKPGQKKRDVEIQIQAVYPLP